MEVEVGGVANVGNGKFGWVLLRRMSLTLMATAVGVGVKWQGLLLLLDTIWIQNQDKGIVGFGMVALFGGFVMIGLLEMGCFFVFQHLSKYKAWWTKTLLVLGCVIGVFDLWIEAMGSWLSTQAVMECCCSGDSEVGQERNSTCDLNVVSKIVKLVCKDPSLHVAKIVPNLVLLVAAGVFVGLGYCLCSRSQRASGGDLQSETGPSRNNSNVRPESAHANNDENGSFHLMPYNFPQGPLNFSFRDVQITISPNEGTLRNSESSGRSFTTSREDVIQNSQRSVGTRNGSEIGRDSDSAGDNSQPNSTNSQPLTQTSQTGQQQGQMSPGGVVPEDRFDYDNLFTPIPRRTNHAGSSRAVSDMGSPRQSLRLSMKSTSGETVKTTRNRKYKKQESEKKK